MSIVENQKLIRLNGLPPHEITKGNAGMFPVIEELDRHCPPPLIFASTKPDDLDDLKEFSM